MALIEAIPNFTRRARPTVSLACRRDSHGGFRWMICISGALRRELAWAEPVYRQGVDPETGKLHLIPTTAGDDRGYAASDNSGAWQLTAALQTPPLKPIGSTFLRYSVEEGGALVIELPVWAGGKAKLEPSPMRKRRGRSVAKGQPKKVVTDPLVEKEDLRDAAVMLRRGDSTASVMDYFGWTREKVDNLRRSLQAMRRAA